MFVRARHEIEIWTNLTHIGQIKRERSHAQSVLPPWTSVGVRALHLRLAAGLNGGGLDSSLRIGCAFGRLARCAAYTCHTTSERAHDGCQKQEKQLRPVYHQRPRDEHFPHPCRARRRRRAQEALSERRGGQQGSQGWRAAGSFAEARPELARPACAAPRPTGPGRGQLLFRERVRRIRCATGGRLERRSRAHTVRHIQQRHTNRTHVDDMVLRVSEDTGAPRARGCAARRRQPRAL